MRSRLLNGYWPFQAPLGYRYEAVSGRGKMLKPDEPLASIIREGLEGYASGRFQTQAEVQRFFEGQPAFPKSNKGTVRAQLVTDILTRVIYAGYLESENWNVSRREAQHEGLITLATFHKIQERRAGVAKAPKRKDISEDFVLRGFVECADCHTPLKAGWSRGRHGQRYPYYLCQTKGCDSYGKSIKRAEIEGEFEDLLRSLTPTKRLFMLAFDLFGALWAKRLDRLAQLRRSALDELRGLEKQADQLLDRIMNAESQSIVPIYEKRLSALESRKLELAEKARAEHRQFPTFEDGARTAMQFIANPYDHWKNGAQDARRNVIKLAFAKRLAYRRGEGYRTPETTLPFKALEVFARLEKRWWSRGESNP
jgi:site-specific DNA recombinase